MDAMLPKLVHMQALDEQLAVMAVRHGLGMSHTPGHQSLLVKLPKTGAVLLSGDAAHFKENWDNRRVPEINFSKEQTSASMQRLADILAREKAQLWINHDKVQRDGQKLSPDSYE